MRVRVSVLGKSPISDICQSTRRQLHFDEKAHKVLDMSIMDVLESMKNEGNVLFQQGNFDEAVQVYSSILEKLHDFSNAADPLEAAVRLNRAWAWIQMSDTEATMAKAERDCTIVIEKDKFCVKAFYRRALARERSGQWKLAMEDVAAMKQLEPLNPFIGPLVERLQQQEDLNQESSSDGAIDTLTDKMRMVIGKKADDAWQMLQADELSLRNGYQTSSLAQRRCQKRRTNSRRYQGNLASQKEISQKTDDLWESLRREEITTVAKAYPRLKKKTTL